MMCLNELIFTNSYKTDSRTYITMICWILNRPLTNWKRGTLPMIEYKIRLTRRAREDLIDIGDYISHTLSSPETAHHFLCGLKKSLLSLKTFPYKFPIIQDSVLVKQNIHYFPYKNYFVFYIISDASQQIIVVRIGYHYRNWTKLLNNPE